MGCVEAAMGNGGCGRLETASSPAANCDHVDMQTHCQLIYQKPEIQIFVGKSLILKLLHSSLNIEK